ADGTLAVAVGGRLVVDHAVAIVVQSVAPLGLVGALAGAAGDAAADRLAAPAGEAAPAVGAGGRAGAPGPTVGAHRLPGRQADAGHAVGVLAAALAGVVERAADAPLAGERPLAPSGAARLARR